jgi:hypothetical protein
VTDAPHDDTAELKARLQLIEDRLHMLEMAVLRQSEHGDKPLVHDQAVPSSAAAAAAPAAATTGQTTFAGGPTAAAEEHKQPAKPKDLGLEAKIGSYWLNRVGLIAVLIGVVSLLLYSFQFFGAGLKIAFGFILATAIIYLSRSPLMKKSKRSFAHGINALGWAIAFFSGYAMYFVPELTLIHSELLGFITLIVLAIGTMYDAISSRSEFTASLSTTFAAVSICLATSSINPFVALLVIVSAASYVAVRQNWFSLLIYATVAFYGAFNYAFFTSASSSNFFTVGFLVCGWLAIHLAVYFAQQNSEAHSKRLIWASVLNAIFASSSLSSDLQRLLTGADAFKVPFALLGTIYLATARLYKRRDDEDLWTLHILIGLSFVNISKWIHFTGLSPAVIDIIQLGLLTVVGLRFKIKAFRWFAVFLAFAALSESSYNGLKIAWLAVCVYGTGAYLYRHPRFADVVGPRELRIVSNIYLTLANIISAVSIGTEDAMNAGWKEFLWTVQVLTNATVALKTHDLYIDRITLLMLILNAVNMVVVSSSENWLPVTLAIIMLYAFAGYCRHRHLQTSDASANEFKERYGLLAGALLLCFLWRSVPGQLVSIAIGLEGMVLIAGGFRLRERLLRISGLVAFAVMAIHLLFIDLASASTIARIISFIITGLLLVGCSYAYAKFGKKLNAPEKTPTDMT